MFESCFGRFCRFLRICLLIAIFFALPPSAHAVSSLYELTATGIDGKNINLAEFKGKVVMVVNTASRCGFTSQYGELESLYEKYRYQDFVILGFPSNDFGGQEPGSNEDVARFCKKNYGVTFPLFQKGVVSGEKKQPVFKFLTEQAPETLRGEIRWNFEKFIVGKNGVLFSRYPSATKPSDEGISNTIESLLREEL